MRLTPVASIVETSADNSIERRSPVSAIHFLHARNHMCAMKTPDAIEMIVDTEMIAGITLI
ncbi:uncharacterized protein K489DRAFT_375830, partial [Dissoconium aciculare CBS 342.82]|uniref:Uncharacterized protein n=1 Tax=Dissoconium aciculare CBS 342.82 TaxID=1314786 RepID=A0A6J3ML20_9PEZI